MPWASLQRTNLSWGNFWCIFRRKWWKLWWRKGQEESESMLRRTKLWSICWGLLPKSVLSQLYTKEMGRPILPVWWIPPSWSSTKTTLKRLKIRKQIETSNYDILCIPINFSLKKMILNKVQKNILPYDKRILQAQSSPHPGVRTLGHPGTHPMGLRLR